MISKIKGLDSFTKNIILVFAGTSFGNVLALLYQLLVAHKLSVSDFAVINFLISLFTIITSPLGTLQTAVVKYSAEFNAHSDTLKIKFLLSDLTKKACVLAVVVFFILFFIQGYFMKAFNIPSVVLFYVFTLSIAVTCVAPVLAGGVQGLEKFAWFSAGSIIASFMKLFSAFVFISLGYRITGAFGALLAGVIGTTIFSYIPIRDRLSFSQPRVDFDYKPFLFFLFPVAVSAFCNMFLVNMDMILVKYYFSQENAGLYSLAQMLGKIFLFLPGGVAMVLLPRTSGLNSAKQDTLATLKKAILYVSILSFAAILFYNSFPSFVLKILTGKVYSESILLGRIFSVSLSFYALVATFIPYFLSLHDLRFIKFMVLFSILQFFGIIFFHQSLFVVQLVVCFNSMFLFCICMFLAFSKPAYKK